MAFYEWTEAMSVGVDLFDSDHKALIGLINRLHESLESDEPAPLHEILDTLIAYAELHFAREEKGLEACRYPEIEIHRDQHAGFTDRIYRARERTPVGGGDAARTGELLTLKLRYKQPDGDTSKLIEVAVSDQGLTLADMPDDFIFVVQVVNDVFYGSRMPYLAKGQKSLSFRCGQVISFEEF